MSTSKIKFEELCFLHKDVEKYIEEIDSALKQIRGGHSSQWKLDIDMDKRVIVRKLWGERLEILKLYKEIVDLEMEIPLLSRALMTDLKKMITLPN